MSKRSATVVLLAVLGLLAAWWIASTANEAPAPKSFDHGEPVSARDARVSGAQPSAPLELPAQTRSIAWARAGVHYSCRILREDTGSPLPFVRARRLARDEHLATIVLEEHSADREGWIELDLERLEDQALLVEAAGFMRAFTTIDPGHETRGTACEIRLREPASLLFHVESSAKRPVSSVTVLAAVDELWDWDANSWLDASHRSVLRYEASTDEHGAAVLENLPAGVGLEVTVLRGSVPLVRMDSRQSLSPGEQRTIELQVGEVPKLRGRLRDQYGAPVREYELSIANTHQGNGVVREGVTIPSVSTWTGAGGEFEFSDLSAGEWVVGPRRKPEETGGTRSLALLEQPVIVAPGEVCTEVELTAWRGVHLRGTVRLDTGEPAPGCEVSADPVDPDLAGSLWGQCDEQGRFELAPAAGVEYELFAGGMLGGRYGVSPPRRARGGEAGIELVVERGATLRVVALDPASQRACEAHVLLVGSTGRPSEDWSDEGTGGPEGVEFAGLATGAWHVLATDPAGSTAHVRTSVSAGERKVLEVLLAPPAQLSVKLGRGTKSKLLELETDGLVLPGTERSLRRVQVFDVPAGRLTVRLKDAEGADLLVREVECVPGQRIDISYPR